MSYSRKTYETVSQEYAKMQQERQTLIEQRRKEVYLACPRIEQINQEIANMAFSLMEDILSNKRPSDEIEQELSQKGEKLVMERDRLMKKCGFSVDYLQPNYVCEKCEDKGYIDQTPCECYKRHLIHVATDAANLSNMLKHQTFENFDLTLYSEVIEPRRRMSPRHNMEKNLSAAKSFVNSFDTNAQSLLFYGQPGLGKTFLSSCIAHAVLEKMKSVIYYSADEVFHIFEKVKFSRDPSEDDVGVCDSVLECDLLVLDDLGTEMITAFTSSVLFKIVNSRILAGKKTIISTNFSLDDLQKHYTQRLFSRLSGHFTCVEFFGTDLRM